jgi:hypothetical protein
LLQPFKAQWYLNKPPDLSFKNFTFNPKSAHMWFSVGFPD